MSAVVTVRFTGGPHFTSLRIVKEYVSPSLEIFESVTRSGCGVLPASPGTWL